MASRNKFVSNLAFVDLLFNILIGVVFLFLIVVLDIQMVIYLYLQVKEELMLQQM